MKGLKFYILLLSLGIIFSCRKKDYPVPEVVENAAIYYSKLLIDNKPFVLEAGVNGYYMYSSYKLDSNFVYGYIADLKKPDCNVCTNSLRIQINDYKISALNAVSYVDSALTKGQYAFLAGNPAPTYSVQFNALNSSSTYHWDFGDGTTSALANPVKFFNKEGRYSVCLKTTSNNSCVSSICNKEKIDVSSKSCKTTITASPVSGNVINFSSSTVFGLPPYQYLWNFGDGKTSNQSSENHDYKYRGAYAVTLRVVDALGDTAYANYNAKTLTDVSSCAANYVRSAITKLPASPALSNIIITWIDSDGNIYTSNSPLQPEESVFEIISVNENEVNEIGQPTKKITAKFNCKLFNGNKSITVNNAEVVIGVAYK